MFLKILYNTFKIIIQYTLYIFYEKVTLIGEKRLILDNSSIVVSNHPNTLIDPIVVAIRSNKQFFFLANAGLFAHPITNWLFRHLWCIPIKRQKDHVNHVNNNDSFKQCDDFLSKNGVLFIAPEGSSWQERHVREIKTGTARIALSAEKHNNFKLGLTIRPVGLTYSHIGFFGARYVLETAEPIVVADFKNDFEKDEEATIDKITALIAERIENACVNLNSRTQDIYFEKCESILLGNDQYLDEKTYRRSQNMAKNLVALENQNPSLYDRLETETNDFFDLLKKNNISDSAFYQKNNIFNLIIGFPIFSLGFVLNFIPFSLTRLLWKKATPLGYDAMVQYVGGLIIFPILYSIEKNLLKPHVPIDAPWYGWLFWTIAMLTGIFSWSYFIKAKRFLQFLFLKNKEEIGKEREILKGKLEIFL